MRAFLISILLLCWAPNSLALLFELPPAGEDHIGELRFHQVKPDEDFDAIARQEDIGHDAMLRANPGIDPDHLIIGTMLVLPTEHLLPNIREGIVINLPEKQLYYFPPTGGVVFTFPVGIGRKDWDTPVGWMVVTERKKHPIWRAPASLRKLFKEQKGEDLPPNVLPGPDNPLGLYALRLSNSAFLIHGTNDPVGVGQQISAGCIRMYNFDITLLHDMAALGTPVRIVNAKLGIGFTQGQWVVASYPDIEVGEVNADSETLPNPQLQSMIAQQAPQRFQQIIDEAMGIPQSVGAMSWSSYK